MSKQNIYNKLISVIKNPYGVCGLMGNLQAESGLKSNNMQNSYESKLGMNDETYTAAVDNGTYANFCIDRVGYGLTQWTSEGRKTGLYNYAKSLGVSIGNEDMQIDYIMVELTTAYKSVLSVLKSAKSVKEASDCVVTKYERPVDQSASALSKRASYGESLYKELAKENKNTSTSVRIGSARSNENGGINGGAAGDQTGGEVSIQNWYLHSKGWEVLRAIIATEREDIAHNMESICANDNIGYCQDHRATLTNAAKPFGYDASKVTAKVETDCSEAVRNCLLYAGINVNSFSTATEVSVLMATGKFEKLTDSKYCNSPDYLLRGDILVTKTKGHTVVVLDNGAKSQVNSSDANGSKTNNGTNYKVGDIVQFTGSTHHTNANATSGKACKPGQAKITAISSGSKHPYHVIHIDSTSNVYGWVDEANISKEESVDDATITKTHKVVKGDTLSAIAKKYGTTVTKIVNDNKPKYSKITANYIVTGWELIV